MNEKEMRTLVRDCLDSYYQEDKKILIDASITQIIYGNFLLYNLIFFGNKVILSKQTYDAILKESKKEIKDKRSEISVKNAGYLIDAMKKDERDNYQIIEMESYGNTKVQMIRNFLKQDSDVELYLSDLFLYESLRDRSINNQLNFMVEGIREVDPFRSKIFKFETVGAIKFEEEKMFIYERKGTTIKVFNKKYIEKQETVKEIKPRDYVLIIGHKEDGYSFNFYQIVSRHTRNHAIRIIWTDLKFGQKTNKYIDRLPYQYKKMILDNVK